MTDVPESVINFGGLSIRYDEQVLAPRPWTAAQAEWAARLIPTAPPGPVLELCAGAGHIGLLAVTLARRSLVQVDANPAACTFARRNASAAGVRSEVREALLSEAISREESFAVIIADPPWVRSADTALFPDDPIAAIDGGADGLGLVRACLDLIADHLVVAGSAVLQVGPGTLGAVRDLVADYPDLAWVRERDFPRGSLVQLDRLSRP